jgi:hypothetical protein
MVTGQVMQKWLSTVPSLVLWLVCFVAGYVTATARSFSLECQEGQPLVVSHIDAYRSSDDEHLLLTEVANVDDVDLRERLRGAFEGKICVLDLDLRDTLLSYAAAHNPAIRAEALNVLSYFAPEVVIESARRALKDSSPRVRLMALAATASICDSAALEQVLILRRNDPDPDVRSYARRVAKEIRSGRKCRPLPRASYTKPD